MSKLFLSVRITKNDFTSKEIEKMKREIKNCNSKSKFLRRAIKNYLHTKEDNDPLTDNEQELSEMKNCELKEIKRLVTKNHLLLKELKKSDFEYNETQKTYEGEEQTRKTDQALNLLNQF